MNLLIWLYKKVAWSYEGSLRWLRKTCCLYNNSGAGFTNSFRIDVIHDYFPFRLKQCCAIWELLKPTEIEMQSFRHYLPRSDFDTWAWLGIRSNWKGKEAYRLTKNTCFIEISFEKLHQTSLFCYSTLKIFVWNLWKTSQ